MMESPDSNAEERETLIQKVDKEVYELHFHSRAHFISADHYENLDQRLTLCGLIFTAIGVACGGATLPKMLSSYKGDMKASKTLIFLTVTSFCGQVISMLYKSGHSPSVKKKRHFEAGSRLKALRKKTDAWLDTEVRVREVKSKEEMRLLLKEYNDIIEEHCKIEVDLLPSRDWTFSGVHSTLPEKWVKRGKRLNKYFPEHSGIKQSNYYWHLAEPYVIITASTALASFGIWRFVQFTFPDSVST